MVSTVVVHDLNPLYQNVLDWLEGADEFAYVYRWNDRMVCRLALNKLKGPAKVWYRGLQIRIFRWEDWKQLLLKFYM